MKFNLTASLAAPLVLLALLVAMAFAALMVIESRLQTANRWSATLSEVQTQSARITASVQTGILTLDDASMIDAARSASEVDAALRSWQAEHPEAGTLLQQFQDFYAGVVSIHSVFLEKRLDEGQKRLGKVATLQAAMTQTVTQRQSEADQARDQLAVVSRSFMTITLLALVGVTLLIIGFVRQRVVRPIQRLQAQLTDISQGGGDLTMQLPGSSIPEIDGIAKSFNQLIFSLREQFKEIREAADSVSTASAEIATGNLDLSHRTEQTASSLQLTSQALETLTAQVHTSTEAARNADQVAVEAATVAQRGGDAVAQVVSTMADINQSSKRIADIISTIDGIAFQTNILALNAAVEAARAGDQGRGFAVVASEVRALAGRSSEAAKEIRGLIAISVSRVDAGGELVNAAGQTINDVVQSVRRVSEMINSVAQAAGEQNLGIDRVTTSVLEVDGMTQQNAALVEQGSAAAQSLHDQAQRLAQIVGRFRLE